MNGVSYFKKKNFCPELLSLSKILFSSKSNETVLDVPLAGVLRLATNA